MKYNYLDLFSGIGGFAYGLHLAGMYNKEYINKHYFSDIEKYPVELYQKRFPDAAALGDITKIDFEKLKAECPGEWIITGGFPCQDISVAGKGKGLIDDEGNKTRSGLWFKYWKAISILRPRFAIIENVRALLNRGLETVLANLAEIGYDAEWQIISAEDMGAPHKRERVWIIAYSDNGGLQRVFQKHRTFKEGKDRTSGSVSLYPTTKGILGLPNIKNIRRGPRVSGKVDRIKSLGNSIVPQIAELLFRQIKPLLK